MLDVAIIGGGVCGCSLLYALSRYQLQAALLEASNDVGVCTTKANSAIIHAGYDPEPGTLMAKYNVQTTPAAEQDLDEIVASITKKTDAESNIKKVLKV